MVEQLTSFHSSVQPGPVALQVYAETWLRGGNSKSPERWVSVFSRQICMVLTPLLDIDVKHVMQNQTSYVCKCTYSINNVFHGRYLQGILRSQTMKFSL